MELKKISHKLPIHLGQFGFVEREKFNGKYLKNRCGRDFLYYALNYYRPKEFNQNSNSPKEIEKKNIFGFSIPANFAWTQIQFYKVPRLLRCLNLELKINDKRINSFFSFIKSIILSNKIGSKEAIKRIKKSIDAGNVVGIDIAIDKTGLLDHVMFVYGYDKNSLYIFDTHIEERLEYEKVSKLDDKKFIMKLPFKVISKRWTRFGRVWKISKF